MKKIFFLLLSVLMTLNAFSQKRDSLSHPLRIVVPSVLAASSLTIMSIDGLKEKWQPALQDAIPNIKDLDEVMAVTPGLITLTCSFAGLPATHNTYTRFLIAVKAGVLGMGLTYALKYATRVNRPDGSDSHSFPSAHTEIAFLGATMADLEFRDVSIAIPISAYTIAAFTGAMRIEHNKHWVSDVLGGAAIGMASVWVVNAIQTDRPNPSWMPSFLNRATVTPFYTTRTAGLSMLVSF
jgi:membrane-associated phospholipid phosphatase